MRVGIINDTTGWHFGCNLVMRNLFILCKKYGIPVVTSIPNNYEEEKVRNIINSCSTIIINGEGTFHHSVKKTQDMLDLCKNKNIILINTVWDTMFVDNHKHISLVSVRESLSYDQAVKAFGKRKVIVTPDLSLYGLPPEDKIGYSDTVLFNLREILNTRNNYYPLTTNATVPSINSYISWLKTLDLYITGRFHGVCLAAMAGTPFVAFPSNCHKIQGILKDMNCEDLLVHNEVEALKKQELAKEKINNAIEYAKTAPEKIEQLFVEVKKVLR